MGVGPFFGLVYTNYFSINESKRKAFAFSRNSGLDSVTSVLDCIAHGQLELKIFRLSHTDGH